MWMPDLYPAQMIHLACTPFPKTTFPEILRPVSQVCHISWKKAQSWQMLWCSQYFKNSLPPTSCPLNTEKETSRTRLHELISWFSCHLSSKKACKQAQKALCMYRSTVQHIPIWSTATEDTVYDLYLPLEKAIQPTHMTMLYASKLNTAILRAFSWTPSSLLTNQLEPAKKL